MCRQGMRWVDPARAVERGARKRRCEHGVEPCGQLGSRERKDVMNGRIRAAWPLKSLLAAAVVGWAACLPAVEIGGLAERIGLALPSIQEAGDIEVSADRMGADRKTNRATLDGHVKVRFSDIILRCDRASYNAASGDIHAEGHVEIVSESGGAWHGEQISFNYRTGEGLLGKGLLRLGTWTVAAGEDVVRDEDGFFYVRNATITTCTNEPSSWHWSVTGDGRYKDREFVELRHAVGRFLGVPVAWMPYYYRDLNTHYGWRFMPGYTGKWGAYLRAGYVYPIAGSVERESLLYGKSILDLRSKYGAAVGQELTWSTVGMFGEDTRQWGRLFLYYANHQDKQDGEDRNWQSSYNEHRWSIGLQERLDFTPRDFLSIAGEGVSDSQFREDYNEKAVRERAQPLGIANYEHRENAWVASLAVMGPINTFYAGTRRLPELRMDVLPRNVFGLPALYYESQTAVGWLQRQPAKYDDSWSAAYRWQPGNWAYYDTLRVDSRHILRRPIALGGGFTLTPRAGWRGTYYGDSPDGGSLFRSLFELGMTLQARYWRDFTTLRHTLIPYLDLTYVPASQAKAEDQPYAFDRLDQAYEWRDRYRSDGLTPAHRYAGLRFGVRNLLQRREKDGLSDLLDADLYGVYVFQDQDHWVRWEHRDQPGRDNLRGRVHREKEETGLRVLGLSGSYAPIRRLLIDTDFQYDPEENRLALWDINARYELSRMTLYAGYLTRDHEVYDYFWKDRIKDSVIYGGFVHHLCDTLDWSLYARYNTEREDLEEVGGFLQYNLDCISFRCNVGYLPSYTSEDGWKHDSDFRISLGAWLRAFPKDNDEDWMMWGDLSNRSRLEGR